MEFSQGALAVLAGLSFRRSFSHVGAPLLPRIEKLDIVGHMSAIYANQVSTVSLPALRADALRSLLGLLLRPAR